MFFAPISMNYLKQENIYSKQPKNKYHALYNEVI